MSQLVSQTEMDKSDKDRREVTVRKNVHTTQLNGIQGKHFYRRIMAQRSMVYGQKRLCSMHHCR